MRRSKREVESAFRLLTEADPQVTGLMAHFFGDADEEEVNRAIDQISEAVEDISNKSAVVALVSVLADYVVDFSNTHEKAGDHTVFLKVVRAGLLGEVMQRWRDGP